MADRTDYSPAAIAVVGLLMFSAGLWRWLGLGVMLTVVGALLMAAAVLIIHGQPQNSQPREGSGVDHT